MKFTEFNLDGGLQEGLDEAGYTTCMPVQEQVLKNGLDGSDLYVQSQTGTGKTAAYLVTILQRLISDPALAGKKALIMVPTRELAVQVEEEARIVGSCMKLKSASFYGGVGYGHQQELLAKGVDVIIGTPGRVIDLQQSGTMKLNEVAFLVIDEADRMFDMGFYPDLRVLIKVLPAAANRQTMLFSATLNATVKNLAWEYTVNAKEVTIEAENVTVDEIDQQLFHVSSDEKTRLLLGIIQKETPESLIVFCNTKRMSEIVAKRLKINGYEADFIIGDLPQSKRLQVIDSFKAGSLKFLVATDVAARGIDVNNLAMVINYDLPNEAENYVHRIGRTARAGKTGKAYSFCSEQDVYNLPAIEKYIENKIPTAVPTDDLMGVDKSAGKYIRTGVYDSDYSDDDTRPRGDGDSRGRSGGGRGDGRGRPSGNRDSRGPRSDSRGPSRDNRGPSSDNRGPRPDNRGPSTDNRGPRSDSRGPRSDSRGPRRDDRAMDNRRPGDGRLHYDVPRDETTSRAPESREDRDLSKLSFEERMAYYKNKYGSEEAAKAAGQSGGDGRGKPDNRSGGSGENRNRNAQSPRGRGPNEGGDRQKTDGNRPTAGRGGDNRGSGRPATGNQGRSGNDGRGGTDSRRSPPGNRPQGGRPNQGGQARGAQGTGGNRDNRGPQGRPAAAKQNGAASAQKKAGVFTGLIKKLFGKK